MDNRPAVRNFELTFLVITIIGLFLCLSWTPAYGYNIARIDNVAILQANQVDGSSANAESNPVLAAGTSQSVNYGDRSSWSEDEPLIYDTSGDIPSNSPPAVPEPATLMLIGIGLAGAAVYRRLRV